MRNPFNAIFRKEAKTTPQKSDAVNGKKVPVYPTSSGNVSAFPSAPGSAAGYEEYTYQPRPRTGFKKVSKILVMVLSFVIVLLPLAFLLLKGNPFVGKNVEKKGEITWWVLGMDERVLKKMIEKYQVKNPKAKINLIVQSEVDYRERLVNSLKEKKGPDVFTIHNSWVPMLIDQLDPVPENVYTKEDYAKDFYPVVVKDMNTTNGIVGISLEYDALTLFVNESTFSSSGETPPRTWDQFTPLATKLTIRGANNLILQSGAAMGWAENVEYWPEIVGLLMLQNKSNLYSPATTNDLSSGAIQEFGNFHSVYKVWDETLPKSTVAFAEGKAAMVFAPARAASEIKKLNPNLNFKTVIVPQVRRDDPNEPEYTYATYWVQSVWNKSGDKDLAWDFLRFLSGENSLQEMHDTSESLGLLPKAYPRISMRDKLINDKIFGSIVALAPVASSWYLADATNDGEEGINSLVNAAYKKVVDLVSMRKGGNNTAVIKALTAELKKVLSGFNIAN